MNRILVVDDKEENLYLLRVLLEGSGYMVDTARHGAEALVKARQHPPRLIISDLLMPVMDGYTLLRHWKADERLRQIPFIVYTATYTEPQDERLALDLGADAFLLKPADPVQFLNRIQDVLAKGSRGKLLPVHAPKDDDEYLLKEYSEALVHKLEEKAFQLEQANQALQEDIARRMQAETESNRLLHETERARAALLSILEDEREAEEALKKSEKRLRDLIDGLGPEMLVGLMTPDGTLIQANRPALMAANLKAEDVLGRPLPETYWLSYSKEVQHQICETIERAARGLASRYDLQIRVGDNQFIPIDFSMHPLRDDTGKVVFLVPSAIVITERKRSEDALRQSERNYREVVESASEVIFTTDVAGNIRYVNPAGLAVSGYTINELRHARYLDLILPEHRERMKRLYYRQFLQRTPATVVEYPFLAKSGTVLWFAQNATLLTEAGKVTGFQMIARDISARKQAEEALREREQQFRLFVEHSPAAIAMLDRDMRYLVTSHRWLTDYHLVGQDIIGRSHYEVFPEIPERWKEIHRRCLGGAVEKSDAEGFPRADGSTDWLRWEVRPWHTARGDIGGLIIFSEVITERVRATEKLREAESRMRLYIAASNIGLWDWDLVSNAVYFSREWKAQLGYAEDEISDRYEEWQSRVHADDLNATLAKVRRFIEDPTATYAIEYRLRHKDGGYRWIYTTAHLFRDPAGKPLHMIGCHIDLTERKLAEMEIQDSREQLRAYAARLRDIREEERTSIAREIHDVLAQELTRLKLDVSWIGRRLTQPVAEESLRAVAGKIMDVTRQTDNAILSVQKIATELRPVVLDSLGLPAAIEWQMEEFQKRSEIQCAVTLPAGQPWINPGQSTALFRILQECLTNILRHARAKHVDVVLAETDGHLLLTVRDDGCGITAEKQHDPRSIGLLGMHERAIALGGSVEISGAPGAGTTVTAQIPVVHRAELEAG